jgi:hypothetical protein
VAGAVSLGLAVAASAALAVLPTGSKVAAVRPGEPMGEVVTRESLLEHEGPSVLGVLAVPVLAAAVGVAAGRGPDQRRARTLSAVLLWVFSVLGAMSIGIFYVPAAAAMTVAACAPRFSRAEAAR